MFRKEVRNAVIERNAAYSIDDYFKPKYSHFKTAFLRRSSAICFM